MSERRPVAGWRENGTAAWALPLSDLGLMEAPLYAIVSQGRTGRIWWTVAAEDVAAATEDGDYTTIIAKGQDSPTVDAAKLAAEDAAADLLLAGLRALGRVA